jgi:hypothetical protein
MRCSECNGSGKKTWEEDGRMVTDACYHCGNTGEVDEETDWHDRLARVAGTIAFLEETDYRKWWDRTEMYLAHLEKMPLGDKELLVAWNEQEPQPLTRYSPEVFAHVVSRSVPIPTNQCGVGDDDIPF